MGEVFEIPASRVIDLPNARDESGYPRVLMAAAWHAHLRGDFDRAEELSKQAIETHSRLPTTRRLPRVEWDAWSLKAMAALAAGDYPNALSAYTRASELAAADGYPGLAAISLAVGMNTALLGGGEVQEANDKAAEAVALARQSGMHAAIVISLNSLALTLVDIDPERARALLQESIGRSSKQGEASPAGILTASLVGGTAIRLGSHSCLDRLVDAPRALGGSPAGSRAMFSPGRARSRRQPTRDSGCLARCGVCHFSARGFRSRRRRAIGTAQSRPELPISF